MMRQMRANVKWIMAFVALSFVGWMMFEVGMDVSGRGGAGSTDEILRVEGTKITAQTFYSAVRNAQEQQRRLGNPVITREDQRSLEDQVIESMVEQILLQNEYKRHGITVSDEEIRQAALSSPPPEVMTIAEFQTEGEFDLAKYQRYIQAQTDPAFLFSLEARYRDELPRVKLFDRLTADIYVSNAKLWRLYRDEHDSVEARLLTIFPAAAVPEGDVQVSDAQLQAYFRENREAYRRPAQAFLSFVSVPRRTNQADSAAALARAEQLRQELTEGADFAEVAQRESADSVSRQNGGDLGELTTGRADPAFERAALALRPGDLSDPVLSQFGYHLIKLESKSADAYRARHILIPIELQGAHLDLVDARGDSLDLLAADQQEPSALDAAAQSMGLQIQTAPPVFEGDRVRLPVLDPTTGAVRTSAIVPDAHIWAFEAIEGETSEVIEAPDAFYVFRLDSLLDAGIPPLERIRDAVRRDAITAARWTRAEEIAAEIDREIRAGTSLRDAAASRRLNVVTLPPFTRINPNPALTEAPEVIGLAFGLELQQIGGPARGERAIYFVQPVARQPADSTAWLEQLEAQRNRVLQQSRQLRVRMVLASLRGQADVVDRRQELARAQREQQELPFTTGPLGF